MSESRTNAISSNAFGRETSQIYSGSPGVGVDGDLVSGANALVASPEEITPSNASASSERILFLPTAALSMHWVNRPTTQGLAMFPEPSRGLMLGSGSSSWESSPSFDGCEGGESAPSCR